MKNFINFSMSVRSSQSLGKKARSSSIVSSVSNKNKRKIPRIDDDDVDSVMMMMLRNRFIIKIFWTILICTHLIMIAL